MRRRDVYLSSLSVDLNRGPIRNPPRPLSLRHEDYEDNFDFTTIFYDCFWDCTGESIILIGPPLLNLEADLDLAIIACPSMVQCKLTLKHAFLGCHVIAKPPIGTTGLILRTGSRESFIAPQPNLCDLFRKRRAIVTLSRNNELIWIRDWIQFNRDYHGCNGALIYDNNSDAYCIDDIYEYLEPFGDDLQIVVLAWPFKYGVADWRLPVSYGLVDSLYCQAAMLEHARHRFLTHAGSVLNTDIDELVITEGGRSIFDLVESSTTGLLVFDGAWVENYPPGPKGPLRKPPRHRNFACVSTADQVGCEPKWAVVPSRVPRPAQWHIHRILGMPPSECGQIAAMRHFKAINTDWTVDRNRSQDLRTSTESIDPQCLRVDVGLHEALATIFTEEADRILAADGARPPRSAYVWRVRAGRFASERRWPEAIEAAQAALCLMPEHPGFRLFLARLREREKNESAALTLRAEAEALRARDPRYHLQCGRWFQDEGNLLAAQRCFAKAIEIDPKCTSAYHEMARNEYYRDYFGQLSKAEDVLETCVRTVPDDALTRCLLAKELERKGRLNHALVHLEVAIELSPENPHYHCFYARVLRRIGRLDAAEQAARQGIVLDELSARMQAFGRQSVAKGWLEYQWRSPTAPQLRAELAEILVAKGNFAAAEAAARQALSLARTEPDRYCRLSEILAMRGCHEEAAEELGAAISMARREMQRPILRDWPRVNRNCHLESRASRLSRILSAAGRRDEAIAALREALVAVPGSSSLKENLAALLVDTGDREAAAALLHSEILKRPGDAKLRHSLSKTLEATDLREAIELAKAAVELEPENPSFQEHLVALLVAAERDAEATRALNAALSINRHHGPLYLYLSRLLQRRRRPEEALAAARRAIELAPQKPYMHEHLAKLLMDAGRLDQAEGVLRTAFELHPDDPWLHLHLSRLLAWRQRPEEALAAARRAVALAPQEPYLHEHLVQLLVEEGEDDEAEVVSSAALELHPDHAGLHLHLSRLLQRRRRPEEALAAARRAVALAPQKPYPHEHLVKLLMAEGEDDEAEVVSSAALELHPDHAGLHLHLSRLLQRRRRPEEALAAARRAVALAPQKPYLHEQLAKLLMEGGRFDQAEAVLRTALELHPADPWLHLHLSRLLQRRQRPEEALAAARRAIELAPEKPCLHEHVLKLLMAEGEDDEAEVVLRQALELHPDDVGLHCHLSQLLQRRQPAAPTTGKSKAMMVATAAAA